MKKNSRNTRQATVLLTSASTLVLLAGCDFTDVKNPFASDRPPQVVDGERRQPIYNQQMIARMQSKTGAQIYADTSGVPPMPMDPATAAAMQQQAMQQQQAIQYEAQQQQAAQQQAAALRKAGIAVPPAAPAAPMQPPQTQLMQAPQAPAPMQNMDSPPPSADAFAAPAQPMMAVQPTAPVPATMPPASAQNGASGSFLSRIFSNNDTTASDNLPPWKTREGVQDDYVDPKAQTAAVATASASLQAGAQPTSPAWADQWIGKSAPQPTATMEAERNAPYPALSSVPPRPSEFETAKTNGQKTVQELSSESATANADRAALSAEPSQTYKATPVEMPVPAANPAADATSETYVTPAQPQEPAMASPDAPRRGVDIMTQDQWQALKNQSYTTPTSPSMPSDPNTSNQPVLEQPPEGQPLPTPELEQHGQLELKQDSIPHLPVSGVLTQSDATTGPAVNQSPFFERVFGSFSKEQTDTNSAVANNASNSSSFREMMAKAEQEEMQRQHAQQQRQTQPANPATQANSDTDPLLALINQTKENEQNETPQLTANKHVLAQMGDASIFVKNATNNTNPQGIVETASTDQNNADASITPLPSLAEPYEATPQAEKSPSTAQASASQTAQPGWMSQLFNQPNAQPTPLPALHKATFGTELNVVTSATKKTDTFANKEVVAPQAETSKLKIQAAAQQVEIPVINRAIIEHNAHMAAAREMKLAKKIKGKSQHETTFAKKEKLQSPMMSMAQPMPSAPKPTIEANAQPQTIWQQAEQDKKNTVTALPTAPEHLQAMLTGQEEAEVQSAEAAAPSSVASLNTEIEVTKPVWYSRMFKDNEKESANSDTAANNNVGSPLSALTPSAGETHTLPSLSATSAPVGEVLEASAAGAVSSLPSPKILQEIKTISVLSYSHADRFQDIH